MLEGLRERWNNRVGRWNEWCTKGIIKHWRKWDVSIMGVGALFFAAFIFVGKTAGLICAVIGTFFLTVGTICYIYDRALAETDHLEEVLREIQKTK